MLNAVRRPFRRPFPSAVRIQHKRCDMSRDSYQCYQLGSCGRPLRDAGGGVVSAHYSPHASQFRCSLATNVAPALASGQDGRGRWNNGFIRVFHLGGTRFCQRSSRTTLIDDKVGSALRYIGIDDGQNTFAPFTRQSGAWFPEMEYSAKTCTRLSDVPDKRRNNFTLRRLLEPILFDEVFRAA